MATENNVNTMNENGWNELTESEKLDALYLAVNDTRQKLNDILIIAADVKEKVGPVVEALKTSPIIKMMGANL